ncbi:MAG TPA: fasciclin domain-containing protein [Saprospiraceae bacterium]|nr:fasciclin domain-containing protein [Saprospiraceae bacterium]
MFRTAKTILFSLSLLIGFTACQKEELTEASSVIDQGIATERNNTIVDIAISNPDFSILVAAVVKTNTVGLFSNANLNGTVFAPTNAAFAQLPAPFNSVSGINGITNPNEIKFLTNVLRYHLIAGRKNAAQLPNGGYGTYKTATTPNDNQIFVSRSIANEVIINGNSKVVAADIQASNGVIHVIDKVLFYPTKDIAQIAIGNGNFTALVAALQKTGLVNTLMSPTTNVTVFAPTDAAFAQLPAPLNNAANIKGINDAATINTLRTVLLYHLTGGRVFSADLRENITVPMVAAGNTTITLAGGAKVKGTSNPTGSNIVLTDLLARNGVIHVIDAVLLP